MNEYRARIIMRRQVMFERLTLYALTGRTVSRT